MKPIMTKGGIFLMVQIEMEKFPKFSSGLEFTNALITEESVLTIFHPPRLNFPGYLRIILTVPEDLIVEAGKRMIEFCKRHANE